MLPAFAQRLLAWFDRHGRHDLPWQHPRDPYRVWLSEIMLQQTQVKTVIPYFLRFVDRFPDVVALAQASPDEVLGLWAGLGYYARARNLHLAAQAIVDEHGGQFPQHLDGLVALPGIGRSTAGAILSQAFGQPHPILDGNVRRLIARHRGEAGWTGLPAVQARLWIQAEHWLPSTRAADYTQAIMDLGSLVCVRARPRCDACPVHQDCVALRDDLTDRLPTPRPRQVRRVRHFPALLLFNAAGELLLEQRPPSGIWGGLWCLPLGEQDETPEAFADRAGAVAQGRAPMAPLRHALTHFELVMLPLRASYAPPAGIREARAQRWLALDAPETWPGMPAPVRALIGQMRQHALPMSQDHTT